MGEIKIFNDLVLAGKWYREERNHCFHNFLNLFEKKEPFIIYLRLYLNSFLTSC